MVRTKQIYVPEVKTPKELDLNKRNTFQYFATGEVFDDWSAFPYPWTREARCIGGVLKWGKDNEHRIDNGVLSIHMTVLVSSEHFVGDPYTTNAKLSGASLSCGMGEGGCVTGEGTFIWDPVEEQCDGFRVTRDNVQGYSVTEDSGSEFFISSDKSLIRLEKIGMTSHCGRVFYSTPYPDIFIHELSKGVLPLKDMVDQRDVDFASYVRNRDEFLYFDIRRQLEAELTYVHYRTCLSKLAERRSNFFLKLEIPGLTSVSLGNGTFGTSGGNVFYY